MKRLLARLLGHRFEVTVRRSGGELETRTVRARGATMMDAWVSLLERDEDPDVEMMVVGPRDWHPPDSDT
jgi:hypothetical protein